MSLAALRLIVVGSQNPVKVGAAAAVFQSLAPNAVVEGVAVASGVRPQPVGDAETRQGARTRAERSLEQARVRGAALGFSDHEVLGLGFEGGVVEEDDGGVRTCAWAAVIAADGRQGLGGSLAMPLPPVVAQLLRRGLELGDVMDQVSGLVNTKHAGGAVGILTGGLISRQQAYETNLRYALAPFLAPAFWAVAAEEWPAPAVPR